jgi:hypothetical protein
MSLFFYKKAYEYYLQVIELLQNGNEPADMAGNMGPDADKNWGYEGILYIMAVLTVKIGSREKEVEKRIEHFNTCKKYLSRLFGAGKASKSRPSDLLERTRDLYDKINEMLAQWEQEKKPLSRYALLVQYDGTNFNGLQIQNGGRTVQDELEKAIFILSKEKVRVIASARTDSGVHAIGQVVHFDCSKNFDLQKLCISLNGILPKDVAVKNAYRVCETFHSRFSAFQREYIYLIYNYPLRTPFYAIQAMWVSEPLSV